MLSLFGQLLHKSDDSWHCARTGGRVDLWTLHNSARELAGRGYKYSKVAIDEAAYARNLELAFDLTIEPTLADYNGDALLTSTPRGTKNDFYKFCRKWPTFRGKTLLNPTPEIRNFYEQKLKDARAGRFNLKRFKREYEAEFIDLTEALVQSEMINFFEEEPHWPHEDWAICTGVDLGISQNEEADYTALVTVARNRKTGRRAVINVQRDHWAAGEIKERIASLHRRYNLVGIAVESTQFQTAWIREFALQRPDLPLLERRPDKDKVMRFQITQQLYALGMMYHSRELPSTFEDELCTFPVGDHDDQVDALVYGNSGFDKLMLARPEEAGDHWGERAQREESLDERDDWYEAG